MKICPKVSTLCLGRFKILPNSKQNLVKLPQNWPKWQTLPNLVTLADGRPAAAANNNNKIS